MQGEARPTLTFAGTATASVQALPLTTHYECDCAANLLE